jgi:molecular chaperone GrpE
MTEALPEDEPPLPEEQSPAPEAAESSAVEELEKKLAEATDKMLRALAEAENTRRRMERERQDTAKYAVSAFARDLLPVADNLRRALNAIPQAGLDQNEQLRSIYTGVEATERELLRLFEKNSIRKVEPLHQKFDPNLHEVIFEGDAAGMEAGTVMQVVEPGYTIHDRLLRPARVGVAKGDAGAADSAPLLDEEV